MPHLTSSAAVWHDTAGEDVLADPEDLDALLLVGQVIDVGALGEEAAVEHEEQVDGLVLNVDGLGEEAEVEHEEQVDGFVRNVDGCWSTRSVIHPVTNWKIIAAWTYG